MEKLFIKDNVINQRQFIVINKDGFNTINPTDEMLFEDGWEVYVKPEPTKEELLIAAKNNKKQEITNYDSSNDVNEFYVSEMPMWLDKATRTGLMLRFNAEIAMGKEETSLWYGNISVPLQLTSAIQMLYALEVYASSCYDVTQSHIAAVEALETIEEVEAYEFTTGYPEKLRF